MHQIKSVRVIVLPGAAIDGIDVDEAISFLEGYDETTAVKPPTKYEVVLRYNNGNKVDGEFESKAAAIELLQGFRWGSFGGD